MANQISPQEFHLLVDNPVIRTKCPQDQITDNMIIKRVKNGNLIAGDIVRVQCMNSDYTDMLAECEYRVTSRKSELVTHEINDRDIRQVEQITYQVERWSGWREVGLPIPNPKAIARAARYAGPGAEAKWNVGKKRYDIAVPLESGEIVVASHPDKETANRIAAGELPLPEAV